MSAVETGQMSAAETGQMSAVETRQMSSVARTDICLAPTHNVQVPEISSAPMSQCSSLRNVNCPNTAMFKPQTCQLSQYHNVQVSDTSIVAISQCSSLRNLNCGNITMFKSQIGDLVPYRRKWPEMGPEWSPGPENRSPGFPRPFPRLWDRSRDPKPPKYKRNSRSTAPGGRYVMDSSVWAARSSYWRSQGYL